RGDRDGEPGGRGDERFGDSASERRRIAYALGRDRVERANHTEHRAEQSHERRERGDRAERPDEAVELMDDVTTGVLDALLHDIVRPMPIGESRRQDLAQRGVLLQSYDVFVLDLALLDPTPYLLRKLGWEDALRLQRPKPFQDDGGRDDGRENNRAHHDAAGFHDLEHGSPATACFEWLRILPAFP